MVSVDVIIPIIFGFLTFVSYFFWAWDGIVDRKEKSKWFAPFIVFGVLGLIFTARLFV